MRPKELKSFEELNEPLLHPPPRQPFTRSQGEVAAIIVATDGVNVYTDNPIYMLKVLDLPADPKLVEEALAGPHSKEWKHAMDKEIETLVQRDTWELTQLSKGKKPVGVKLVLKVKTNADGSLDKFKARLVAKGFTQIEGRDFYSTFAHLSDFTTARMFLSITAVKRMHLVQLDLKNAFLYGNVDADIYMKQPEGYQDGTHRVCNLIKSQYGRNTPTVIVFGEISRVE